MGLRYWVGVDSNWHDADNWAVLSGGAGGAGIPTSSDDVFFDGNGNDPCQADSPIRCRDLTLLAAADETVIINTDATIYGDFEIRNGYFGPTGGPDHIIEFKGNWLNTGGTFAVGTGTGTDPTCVFSGSGKTYALNQLSSASYQNFSVTGTLTMSGTRLAQANIQQKVSVTGTLTINRNGLTICNINLDGTNAGFGTFTGEITGTGMIWYDYRSTSTMITTGTLSVEHVRYRMSDATATLQARTYESTCEVQIEYRINGQVFTMGAGRHYFLGDLTILEDLGSVSAEWNCSTNDAEIWVGNDFDVDRYAFPSGTFTMKWGDGVHVIKHSLDIGSFSQSSSTSHLVVDAGQSTIILWPESGGGIPLLIKHRMSRVYTGGIGGQDYITYNKVYIFEKYPTMRGAEFIEGFAANEVVVESYRSLWSFRKDGVSPEMIYEFDRMKVLSTKHGGPQIKPITSIGSWPFGLDINEESDVFECAVNDCDASYGDTIEAYNSTELGTLTDNVEFYFRDVQDVSGQRNVLNARAMLTPTQVPEPIVEPLLGSL